MEKLEKIKKEKKLLENILLDKRHNSAAVEAYNALKPYFEEVDKMDYYYPIGKIRLVRLFFGK